MSNISNEEHLNNLLNLEATPQEEDSFFLEGTDPTELDSTSPLGVENTESASEDPLANLLKTASDTYLNYYGLVAPDAPNIKALQLSDSPSSSSQSSGK